MVIRDQFRRTPVHPSLAHRLSSIFGIDNGITAHHPAVAIVVGAVLLAAVLACIRDGLAQPIVLLLGGNFLVLLTSPSYYRHYAEFVAAPAVLLIAIAADRMSRMVSLRPRGLGIPAVIAGALTLASGIAAFVVPEHVHTIDKQLAVTRPLGCLKSDDPGVLIQMNRLSEGFRRDCHQGVDIWGAQQDLSSPADWQQYLVDYLTSGGGFILARENEDDLTAQTVRRLNSYPPLARGGGLTLRGRAAPSSPRAS